MLSLALLEVMTVHRSPVLRVLSSTLRSCGMELEPWAVAVVVRAEGGLNGVGIAVGK
jgi:hypothetical protein